MLLELLSAITTKMLYLILHIENAGSFPKPLSGAGARGSCENARRRQIGAQRTH